MFQVGEGPQSSVSLSSGLSVIFFLYLSQFFVSIPLLLHVLRVIFPILICFVFSSMSVFTFQSLLNVNSALPFPQLQFHSREIWTSSGRICCALGPGPFQIYLLRDITGSSSELALQCSSKACGARLEKLCLFWRTMAINAMALLQC